MRYESPDAFRTALEQRLKNESDATAVALLRLRKRVAFERLLAREVGLVTELRAAHTAAARFLDPVLGLEANGR